ncbi:hypothetical protein SEA_CECE_229 [Microbacterium phage Cece]|nr:hypothetical protein SEA_CECE_229 [Microbacterium phage Cece]
MSDVGDVNRAHSGGAPRDITETYIEAARRVMSPNTTMKESMAFAMLHKPENVLRLANVIEALRAENAFLMEQLYGSVDTGTDT